jgi:hypothetical protein
MTFIKISQMDWAVCPWNINEEYYKFVNLSVAYFIIFSSLLFLKMALNIIFIASVA